MTFIVGVAGFTGTGKTTAVRYLAPRLDAKVVYLGQAVIDEVARLQLEPTPDNERKVRMEMRRTDPAALPRKMIPVLQAYLDQGTPVVMDAIMSPQERDLLVGHFGISVLKVVSFIAPMKLRLTRLGRRSGKTATPANVLKRDAVEKAMGIVDVVDHSDCKISNDRSLARFHDALHQFKLQILRASAEH